MPSIPLEFTKPQVVGFFWKIHQNVQRRKELLDTYQMSQLRETTGVGCDVQCWDENHSFERDSLVIDILIKIEEASYETVQM